MLFRSARRAQAMAALVEQAGLSSDQEKATQAIYDQMNTDLKNTLQDFVEKAQKNGKADRRDVMALGADVLEVMVATDDALRQQIPSDALEALDPEVTDPFAFVSGEVVKPLADLKDMDFE